LWNTGHAIKERCGRRSRDMPIMLLVAVGILLFVGVAAKFRKYNIATLALMGVGAILFFTAPWNFFDSDVLGFSIFLIGLLLLVVGLIVRRVRSYKRVS
jgi:predicted membrane channel-forming protein YqfA (hemolysin III family)